MFCCVMQGSCEYTEVGDVRLCNAVSDSSCGYTVVGDVLLCNAGQLWVHCSWGCSVV